MVEIGLFVRPMWFASPVLAVYSLDPHSRADAMIDETPRWA